MAFCIFISWKLERKWDTCLEKDVCDQLCVHVNGSFACDCLEGYSMNPATRECKAKGVNPVCMCVSVCVCAPVVPGPFRAQTLQREDIFGFILLLAFPGNQAEVVFTSSKGAQWMSVTGTEHRELAPHLSGPGPVAALASNHTLYWARRGRGAIYRYQSGAVASAATTHVVIDQSQEETQRSSLKLGTGSLTARD